MATTADVVADVRAIADGWRAERKERQARRSLDQADFDHHGYGKVVATSKDMEVDLVRMETIKKKTTKTLTPVGFSYKVVRGQTSIKGVNGPDA